MNRKAQTSVPMAKVFLRTLIGDGEWETPGGIPAYTLFATLDLGTARAEYEEIYQLPEGERMRDIMERLGEDGRVA